VLTAISAALQPYTAIRMEGYVDMNKKKTAFLKDSGNSLKGIVKTMRIPSI